MSAKLSIGDRVRLRDGTERATVFANPYTFRGKRQVAVVWDHQPKHALSVEVSRLVWVVPDAARPESVGALQHPERGAR